MGRHDVESLSLRHKEIIRLAFLGRSAVEIAGVVGMDRTTVLTVLRSPLAKLELDRLTQKAEEKLVDVPARAALMSELSGVGVEAVRINRSLMRDDMVAPRVRAGIARHFIDRVVFGVEDEDKRRDSFREILRRLDTVQVTLSRDLMITPIRDVTPVDTPAVGDESSNGGTTLSGNGNGHGD